jgi:penicillin-binding protein 1B
LRIRIGQGKWGAQFGLVLLGTAILLFLVATGIGTYYWISYGRMIDLRLSGHIQQTTARIYAAPVRIYTGEALTVADLADHLQRAGYSELDVSGTPGRYILHGNSIEIHPSSESLFGVKSRLIVEFSGTEIQKIRSMETGAALDSAEVEPELLTSLFDS